MIVAARNPAQYRLRAAVAAIAAIFMFAFAGQRSSARANGLDLFTALHGSVITVIIIVGTALTSDLISRERREGTLDLLFLTPLTSTRIISSKLFSQALLVLTVWCATLPITAIPLLSGGLDPTVLALSICTQLACIVISLIAGLTVSVFLDRRFAAFLTSIPIALFAISVNFLLLSFVLGGGFPNSSMAELLVWTFLVVITLPVQISPGIGTGRVPWPAGLLNSFAADLIAVLALTAIAAVLLGRLLIWQRQSTASSSLAAALRKVFLTPAVFQGALQHRLQSKLTRNPLHWLEYRNPWSRSARWIVCGGLILVESYVITHSFNPYTFAAFQLYPLLAVDLLVCITSSLSFQREKENGAFELLLVAPFSEERLIWGRISAVWSYYKPVGILLAAFHVLGPSFAGFAGTLQWPTLFGAHLLSACLSVITITLAGFYFALTRRHFLAILACTAFTALFVPYGAPDLLSGLGAIIDGPYSLFSGVAAGIFCTVFVQGSLISFFTQRILRCLRNRDFAF